MVDDLRGVVPVPSPVRIHGHRRYRLLRARLETLAAGHHTVRPPLPAALVVSPSLIHTSTLQDRGVTYRKINCKNRENYTSNMALLLLFYLLLLPVMQALSVV